MGSAGSETAGPGAIGPGTAGLGPDEMLVAFTRTVRHAGVLVTADRTQAFLRAASLADAGDRQGVFWAGRSTLCSSPEDLERYDAAFRAWFSAEGAHRLILTLIATRGLRHQRRPLDCPGRGLSEPTRRALGREPGAERRVITFQVFW